MHPEDEHTFIINACLTGMMARKEHNAALPVRAEEIATDARACVEAGASILHLHGREEDETPDWRPQTYARILGAVREVAGDAILCVSTSGRRVQDLDRRAACLDVSPRPDMASLTLGSLNFLREGVVNAPSMIRGLARRMAERGVRPELEVFDIGMARMAASLVDEGVLEPPCYVNILLGNAGTAGADAEDLCAIVRHLPEDTTWCVAGIGRQQLRANTMGLLFGDGVRVGLEDNLYIDENKSPATNAALIRRITEIGRLLGLRPATPSEVRARLGLSPTA